MARMTNPTFLAIVPARGGSKGIPNKNIIPVGGKPLICWTIEAGLQSKYVNKTIVSSDDDKILNVSKSHGAAVLKRPDAIAEDTTPTEPVITHVIETLAEHGEHYDYIVLLQPTSPLRNSEDIDNAIAMLLNSEAGALISVVEPEHTPYKAFKLSTDGYLESLFDETFHFLRRQDLPPTFLPNGAIYVIDTDTFLSTKTLLAEKTLAFEMSSQASIDIDTMSDVKLVEEHLNTSL